MMHSRRLRLTSPRLQAFSDGYDLGYLHGTWDGRAQTDGCDCGRHLSPEHETSPRFAASQKLLTSPFVSREQP